MWRRSASLVGAIAVAGFVSVANSQTSTHQPASPAGPSVRLVKLQSPVYPEIARTANIYGDVRLRVEIRPDGNVESVEYVSGPPLLKKAAVESAQRSTFECRECSTTTPYGMVYSFQLTGSDCCNTADSTDVSQSENHVWVTAWHLCICDLPAIIKFRSIKCLYLWRCGSR